MSGVVLQMRCVACGREQYAPAVWDVSQGQQPCVWCGQFLPVFTSEDDYRAALDAARARSEVQP